MKNGDLLEMKTRKGNSNKTITQNNINLTAVFSE